RHRPGRLNCERNIEPVERDRAVAAALDVEGERHVAHALGRARGQGSLLRHEAGAHDGATAVLEIVTREVPLNSIRHRSLLVGANPMLQRLTGSSFTFTA